MCTVSLFCLSLLTVISSRYNLKRRVASLPPLTSEIFAEKVLANKASAAATAARASFEKVCPACQKTYFSENAYQNHLGSQKHKLQVARMHMQDANGDDAETGSVMSSTFSLGEPLETASTKSVVEDPAVEEEFNQVVAGVQDTNITEGTASASRRPSRPHHSGQEMQEEHPLSQTTTETDQGKTNGELLEVSLNHCLFCNQPAADVEANVLHMSKQHGMFIPEREYLDDLEGLLGYLHEKIFDFHECLYCGQMKHTTSGVQTHMRDRGHCMIPYGTEDEMLDIGDFYDFRATYSDEEDEEMEDEQEGGVKLGVARSTKITVDHGNGDGDEALMDEEEDGWESDASSLSSVPTDEITSVPIDDHSHRYKTLDKHRHHSHTDPRPHRNLDGFHSHAHSTPHAVYHDDYELHLPSGRTAGHRSLNKYYRQNLRNYPSPAERAQQRAIEGRHDSDEEMEDGQLSRQRDRGRQVMSRANGGTGMIGVSDAKKREVRAVEKRAQKQERRAQANYQWGNNKQSNSQKHFRVCQGPSRVELCMLTMMSGSVASVVAEACSWVACMAGCHWSGLSETSSKNYSIVTGTHSWTLSLHYYFLIYSCFCNFSDHCMASRSCRLHCHHDLRLPSYAWLRCDSRLPGSSCFALHPSTISASIPLHFLFCH